jgi:glutamine synthetase
VPRFHAACSSRVEAGDSPGGVEPLASKRDGDLHVTTIDALGRSVNMADKGGALGNGTPSEIFSELALDWRTILQHLDGEDASTFQAFVQGKGQLSVATGNRIGAIVKDWAQKHGATHYAHWFQPLTGQAAEKHDAFLNVSYGHEGQVTPVEELKWSTLTQGEPDASSFPSGGLRATHTARGYTVWDPATPLFIRDSGGVPTLCVPCAYVSFTGHSLDYKTPLLRALSVLNQHATRFVNLLGGKPVESVNATLGLEQEYFLIDKELYAGRPDLVMAGRTLIGARPPKHQQLEDHYFGLIPARVQAFMADVEGELYRLGVPVKTRHAEVAPTQFELAPIFEPASVAVDHNVMTMEVLRRVADEHGLVCLLHEKPYAGINGSGKHNNWSMATNLGDNLLDPGNTADEHTRFLAVLSVILLAVHRHADVMRATIASAGNDHRLGANEAPPPIISAYLGTAIDQMVNAGLEGYVPAMPIAQTAQITDRISARYDSTDRNRTAPFAFTGNKFEFRAVGSSENCAWPMTVLNTAVAEAFADLADRLEAKLQSTPRESAITDLIKEVLTEVRSVCFEGDGYSQAWYEEAARRGLPILKNTPAALAVLMDQQKTGFLAKLGVLSADELAARYEIGAERYIKILEIEAGVMVDMARTDVLPALENQLAQSAGVLKTAAKIDLEAKGLRRRVETLVTTAEAIFEKAEAVETLLETLHDGHDAAAAMAKVADELIPAMAELRTVCDSAEKQVADDIWPLPKYREILFPVD